MLAHSGQPAFYRVAAAQLRLLLCDTTLRHNRTMEISLARRLLPGLALHPFSGGVFERRLPRLSLEDWLAQPALREGETAVTIRQVIREVCDREGGVHVDLRAHPSLEVLEQHRLLILCIGDYVLGELDGWLKQNEH